MTFVLWPRAAGTATPTTGPSTPPVPTVHARVAWRDEGFTMVEYDGSTTTGWSTAGTAISGPVSSLTSTESDSFGGGSSLELVTAGTAASGVDFPVAGTAVSGREYRYRVGLRSVSGSTSTALRVGNATDYAATTATITTDWAWHTVDWTPGTAVSDAYVSIQNGAAATQTTRLDHPEVYEKTDEVVLQDLDVKRGSRFDGGAEAPGRIRFTLLDPDQAFMPRNTASALSGLVTIGRTLHIRATYDGRLYPLAFGIIDTIEPDPDTRTVGFEAADGLSVFDGYSVSRPFRTDLSFAEARAAAISAEALGASQHDLTTDSIESNTFVDGLDATTALTDYLSSLNLATGSVHFCKPTVSARYPWKYTTRTRAQLTNTATGTTVDDDFQRLSGIYSRAESVTTTQRVAWRGYVQLPAQTVVTSSSSAPGWTYADERFGTSFAPLPDEAFSVGWDRGDQSKTHYADTPVPVDLADGETAVVVAEFDVPMMDLTATVTDTNGYVSATWTAEPSRLTLFLEADGGSDSVTAISISAKPHIPLDQTEEEASASGSTVVREGQPLVCPELGSLGAAYGLAEYITWRYGSDRMRPDVVDQHHPQRQLTIDVGSRVTLSADRWLVAETPCVVRTVRHQAQAGGQEWETTYGLEELPTGGDWFTLDTTGELDGVAVLAH